MEKQIIKFGNSIGLTFDKVMQVLTEFKCGDNVEIKCSKGKMIIKKIEQK